jgi:hypothetical protein
VTGKVRERRIQSLNRMDEFDVPSAICIVDQRKGFAKAISRHPLQTEIESKYEDITVLSVAGITPHSSREGRRSSNMRFLSSTGNRCMRVPCTRLCSERRSQRLAIKRLKGGHAWLISSSTSVTLMHI